MEYRILGPLEVADDGAAVPIRAAKHRAVLGLLLLHAGEVVPTDRIVDELWGESPPATATKTVQLYVSQLRRALGGGADLVTAPPGYVVRADPESIDAVRFRRLLAEARAILAEGRHVEAAAPLADALALWRGRPLAGIDFAASARAAVDELEELRLGALMDRIDCDLALGRADRVIGELEALGARHPFIERLRGQLMLALYRAGRQADALDAYQRGRREMVEELGIEPGRALREMERAILRQDPVLDGVSAAARPPRTPDPARGLFVGREAELAALGGALEAAIGGHGSVMLLVGEPGIGKSRLADEVLRRARDRGALTLVGRCWEAGGAPAYWPWVQSLRMCIDQVDPGALRAHLGAGAGEIAQILPELHDVVPDLLAPPAEAEGARFRLFDATARFLSSLAEERPVVLALDDLHAADEPSLLLLRFVAGEIGAARILVVGTYRDVDPTVRDPLASTLAELAREQVTRRVPLAGLTVADVARFIELTAGATRPEEVSRAIHAETEGNPLFVGEVVRLLDSEGLLDRADADRLWTLGVPQGVREVIGRRVRRLTAECARVLTLAAVLGREFDIPAIERLAGLSADDLLDVLDEAVAARVLAPVPGARARLRFAHALIRETLYDGLTTPRRVSLHGRAAEALESLYASDPEPHLAELAHHYFEAAAGGDAAKAHGYARQAGERALRLLAYEEAARSFGLALQAVEMDPRADRSARGELLVAIGDALARAGGTTEAKEAFLAAADIARKSGSSDQLARAALGYGGRFPWLRAGSDARLVPLLREALDALPRDDTALRARLLARLAGALRDEPDLGPRSAISAEAVAIARRLGDPGTLGYTLASQFTAIWGPDTDELEAIADEVARLAESSGEAERALDACWLRRVTAFTVGDVDEAIAVGEEHGRLADQLKQPSQQWYDAVMTSTWALMRGELEGAERLAEDALRRGLRAQTFDAECSHRLLTFVLRREQGRLPEIEPLLRRSVDEYPGYPLFRCFLAILACDLGREEEARARLDDLARDDFAAIPRDSGWLACMCLLAEVAARVGDRARADGIARRLEPYARLHALTAGEASLGSVSRYVGLAAASAGRADEAVAWLEGAIDLNGAMGARPWVAHAQADLARLLLARDRPGDRARAEELRSEALWTFRELGLTAGLRRLA